MNRRLITSVAAAAVITAAAVAVPSAAAGAFVARPAAAAGLPAFAVITQAHALKIVSTGTGDVTGMLKAPAGLQFQGVASGGTASTFLAYANPTSVTATCHAYYYRFQLSAAGKPSAPTLVRSIAGSAATAIAASPGGGTYTYSAAHCYTFPPNGLIGISGQAGTRTWAYDEADDYTDSLAADASAGKLALSLYAGSGFVNLLLNTTSHAATVDKASHTLPAVPYAQTLAISPSGGTLYACISNGAADELAAYSTTTGKLIQVLHRWKLAAGGFCQVSASASGTMLLASYASSLTPHPDLLAINPQAGTAVKLPIQAGYMHYGVGATW